MEALATPAKNPPDQERILYADAARGICILLVVLHHVTVKHFAVDVPDAYSATVDMWNGLSTLLRPVRMPLFFLLSGCFAASAIRRPWRAVLRRRILVPYAIYAAWLCIHGIVFTFERTTTMNRTRGLGELAQDLLIASTGLWYLYALVLYFVITKVLSTWDDRWAVGLALVATIAFPLAGIEAVNRESIAQHFVYFVLGATFPHLATRLSALPVRIAVAMGAALVVASQFAPAHGPLEGLASLALAIVSVPAALAGARAMCRVAPLGTAASFVGRRTLGVYVLHMLVLAIVARAGGISVVVDAPAQFSTIAVALYPLLATVAIAGCCILIAAGLARTPVAVLVGGRPQRRSTMNHAQPPELVPLPSSGIRHIVAPLHEQNRDARKHGCAS